MTIPVSTFVLRTVYVFQKKTHLITSPSQQQCIILKVHRAYIVTRATQTHTHFVFIATVACTSRDTIFRWMGVIWEPWSVFSWLYIIICWCDAIRVTHSSGGGGGGVRFTCFRLFTLWWKYRWNATRITLWNTQRMRSVYFLCVYLKRFVFVGL